jgi:predicted AAA+ superfamily ATPase
VFPFDFKKEKHISTKSKYYFTDTGMRNCLNHFELSEEIRKENFLFQQLLSHEYTIYS